MGFIKLNRFGDPREAPFEPKEVLDKVRDAFGTVKVLPGDQLAIAAERAAESGAPEHVVHTLRRNQRDYGPAYAFEIPADQGTIIQGRARRYDVTFLFAHPLTDEWRQRLLSWLASLGPGRIEEAADVDAAKP